MSTVVESWVALFNAGEFEALAELYTDGALLISSSRDSSRFEDRSAIADHFAPGLPEGIQPWVGDVEVDLHGDVATAIGPRELMDPDGRLEEGYIVLVKLREGDAWRIYREMDNYTWRRGG